MPLNRYFLGMDLALTPQQLGGLTYALPVLVAFTSWLQTKMTDAWRRRWPGSRDEPEHDDDDAPDVRLL